MLLVLLLLNLGFLAALSRLSTWYKLKAEDYLFHLMCLNLVVVLMYIGKQLEIGNHHPVPAKFFVLLVGIHIALAPFSKSIQRKLKLFLERFRR
ncbi:hypothetical protein POKO110462_01590 [Pontibacter korlensis]|uniref:Uncharacterized protein n=1 Tax=Pontibacter korlensis TaxID=400092 RepID=A0A0E3ZFK1_9BACT|nr:hypothetical protein PKOR_07065 [Pontibacter korlensis]